MIAKPTDFVHYFDMKYNVRNVREAKGLTVEATAREVGISKGYLSMLERGLRQPSMDMVESIAQFLGVQPLDLLVSDSEDEEKVLAHLRTYRRLSPQDQDAVSQLARRLKPHQET